MNEEIHISADATEVLHKLYSPVPGDRAANPLVVDSEKEANRFSACMSLMLNRIVSMQEIETMPRVWLVWPAMKPIDSQNPGILPAVRKKKTPAPVPETGQRERRESPAEAVQRRLGWMRIPRSRVKLIVPCPVGTIGMLWQDSAGFHFGPNGSICPDSAKGSLKAAQLRDESIRFLWFSFDMFAPAELPATNSPDHILASLAQELGPEETLDHGLEPEDGSHENE